MAAPPGARRGAGGTGRRPDGGARRAGYPWSLTVHAVCAVRPPGWTIESAFTATTSNLYNQAIASCPAGTVTLGLGFNQSETSGQVVLTDANPGTASVSALAYEDDTGYAGTWWVGAYVICAEEPIGWELFTSSNQTSYPATSELTGCTTGKMAVQAGGDLDYAYGEVTLKSLKTISYYGDYGSASAAEDEDGTASTWDLTTDVICASA